MAKKKVSQVNKEEEAKAIAFMEDLKAVEEKHGMRVVPMLQYTNQGIYPTLGRQVVDKVELKADPKPDAE